MVGIFLWREQMWFEAIDIYIPHLSLLELES